MQGQSSLISPSLCLLPACGAIEVIGRSGPGQAHGANICTTIWWQYNSARLPMCCKFGLQIQH